MKFNNLLLLVFICSLFGCGGEDTESDVYVYDDRMLIACDFSENISIQESAESLSQLGIDVLTSYCSVLTNISLTESCNDLSGEFYIHKIRNHNQDDILDSHFKNIDSLNDFEFPDRYIVGEGDVGYEIVPCT